MIAVEMLRLHKIVQEEYVVEKRERSKTKTLGSTIILRKDGKIRRKWKKHRNTYLLGR